MGLSRSRKIGSGPTVEINVVPLVDVALVLLIIFMVTATFMKSAGLHIQLPSSSATQPSAEIKQELVIGIDADGRLLWQGAWITDEELAAALQEHAEAFGTESHVTVHGDARAPHGRVVKAMSLAQQAGFSRLVIAARKEVPRDERGR